MSSTDRQAQSVPSDVAHHNKELPQTAPAIPLDPCHEIDASEEECTFGRGTLYSVAHIQRVCTHACPSNCIQDNSGQLAEQGDSWLRVEGGGGAHLRLHVTVYEGHQTLAEGSRVSHRKVGLLIVHTHKHPGHH